MPRKRKRAPRRSNGEGSVYLHTTSGRWCASITLDSIVDESGSRRTRRKTVFTQDRATAEAKLAELRRLKLGEIDLTADQTLAEYLRDWLVRHAQTGVRPRTMETYRHAVENNLIPVLGHHKLSELTPRKISAALDRLGTGDRLLPTGEKARPLAAPTVAMSRSVLSTALRDATRNDLIVANPVDRLGRMRHASPVKDRSLTDAELRSLMHAASAADRSAAADGEHGVMAPFIALLAMGLRISEALAVRWSDVSFERGVVDVNGNLYREPITGDGRANRQRGAPRLVRGEPKTAKSRRSVAVPASVLAILEEHRRRQVEHRLSVGPAWIDTDAVLASPIGTWSDDSAMRKRLSRLGTDLGIDGLHPHLLRHSAASWAVQDGASLAHVSGELGHSNIAMTVDRYTHLNTGTLGAIASAVEKRLG